MAAVHRALSISSIVQAIVQYTGGFLPAALVSCDFYSCVAALVGNRQTAIAWAVQTQQTLHWAVSIGKLQRSCTAVCEQAENVAVLQLAHCLGFAWSALTSRAAAAAGRLDCLQFLYKHGCTIDLATSYAAAESASLRCLQFLLETHCPCDEGTTEMAASKSLECLKLLIEHGCAWDYRACEGAAVAGSVQALVYLRSRGATFGIFTAEAAARAGHVAVLEYLYSLGCTFECLHAGAAASGGHLPALQFLVEHGCSVDDVSLMRALAHTECVSYLLNIVQWPGICLSAAGCGQLEVLQLACARGYTCCSACGSAAAAEGSLPCLRFCYEQGGLDADDACCAAASGGHLECLKFAHEVAGGALTERTAVFAVEGDHLNCLLYMGSQGCNVHADSVVHAAVQSFASKCLQAIFPTP